MAVVTFLMLAGIVVIATGCRSDGAAAVVGDAGRSMDLRLRPDSLLADSATLPNGPHDTGVRPDVNQPTSDAGTGPALDGGQATEDAASALRDARAARDAGGPELEAHWREIALRFCDEERRCGEVDAGRTHRIFIRGCSLVYSSSVDGCIADYIDAMGYLNRCCRDEVCSGRACACQWLVECEQHYSTARCDPDVDRSIEALPQCMAAGGPPIDGDPTCPQGPITTCDAGVP